MYKQNYFMAVDIIWIAFHNLHTEYVKNILSLYITIGLLKGTDRRVTGLFCFLDAMDKLYTLYHAVASWNNLWEKFILPVLRVSVLSDFKHTNYKEHHDIQVCASVCLNT